MVLFVNEEMFNDKEKILEDLKEFHRGNKFTDVTINLYNDEKVSTSKYMLACRSPFFSKFLKNDLFNGDTIDLKSVDLNTMNMVLDYIFEGVANFKGKDNDSILKLLEASRMLCIDRLQEAVMIHFNQCLVTGILQTDDILESFEFSVLNKFDTVSNSLLEHIDKNIETVSKDSKFSMLSETSVLVLLDFEMKYAKEIDRFRAFNRWVENKNVATDIMNSMTSLFDLKKFTQSELKIVRKTKYFKVEDILDVLDNKFENLEMQLKDKENLLNEQNLNLEKERNLKRQNLERERNLKYGLEKIKKGGRLVQRRI